VCIIGIPSGRVFFPDAKGFRLNNAYGLPNRGFSADFAPRGVYFRRFGSNEFPNTFREKHDSQMQTQKNHRSTSTEIKSSLFIADIKHP
jgi:hypothetical protein